MSKKYRVEQNGQFLGHWTAHTPEEAVNKMLNSSYLSCYDVNAADEFIVSKNDKSQCVYLEV